MRGGTYTDFSQARQERFSSDILRATSGHRGMEHGKMVQVEGGGALDRSRKKLGQSWAGGVRVSASRSGHIWSMISANAVVSTKATKLVLWDTARRRGRRGNVFKTGRAEVHWNLER